MSTSGPRARFTTPVLLGDMKMDTDRILTATKFRRWIIHTWKPMTQTRVRQALEGVRSLYLKDGRLEAKVSLESMKYDAGSNTALPTLRIDAGPRIEVHTIGAKISQSQLRRYVPIFEEHTVDHDLLAEGARNLRDYLQSEGYFEAEVEFKQQRVINDKATIDYLVNQGARHKLVYIEIDGNQYFSTEAIRERMFLRRASFLQFPHGRYSENLLRRDEESIRNLYQSNGFRDVKVTHRTQDDYQGRHGELAVFLQIEEGSQYFVDQPGGGRHRASGREEHHWLPELFGGAALQRIHRGRGPRRHPGASISRRDSPTPPSNGTPNRPPIRTASILSYVIHEGQQQFVRQVIYNGNKITKPRLVNKQLELNPGDPLSPTAITDTQRRLYDLGVFARVDAAIQDPDGETDRKYVLYDLDEARRYSLAVGGGRRNRAHRRMLHLPGCARRPNGLFAALFGERHAQQSMGPGAQPQPLAPAFPPWNAARCSPTPGRISATTTSSASPSPACTTIRATCAPLPSSAKKVRCSSRTASPRPPRCSTATVSGG